VAGPGNSGDGATQRGMCAEQQTAGGRAERGAGDADVGGRERLACRRRRRSVDAMRGRRRARDVLLGPPVLSARSGWKLAAVDDGSHAKNSTRVAPRPAAPALHGEIKPLPPLWTAPASESRSLRAPLSPPKAPTAARSCERRSWTSAIAIPTSTLNSIAGLFAMTL
jgi:hypothetical protein